MSGPNLRRMLAGFEWEQVERLAYKPEGSAPFRDITRQTLFRREGLDCELRYFEIAPGGHSTLERHEHEHAVMILRGAGACLVGRAIHPIGAHDLVAIPALSWHQFRAAPEEPLGFLCMVNVVRDRPRLPDEDELTALRQDPEIAAFIRV